ncbi:tumor necrosis factor receptor superfamily member 9 [Pantherophis guttatus]|uniref:Tumor necrosis factor receptor superfamily member 9 n=1 Tax=Pantherophis guttatus TaxID=94885 RepID=A0A6P9AQE4_PANGU|nr:tumor necrosis factor receptor superfamily member 9 [Pantherophis guttatus]
MEMLYCALLLLLWTGVFCKSSCPNGTFSPGPSESCRQCSVCDRTLVYKQKCTKTTDAICECARGYSCGQNCEACECPLGQQRTITGCQKCPEKTFNDRPTGECKPWKKCPGDKIREPGTKERDVVCWSESEIPTTKPSTSLAVFSTKASEEGKQLILITTAFVITAFLFATCMVLAYLFFRSWIQKKPPKPSHGQLAQEVDDCTYRYPEEEEGGSCEAPSSLKGGLLE